MKVDTHAIKQRQSEIERYCEDLASIDRMTANDQVRQRLEQQLSASNSPQKVAEAMQHRNECRRHLLNAMAMCERVEVRNGIVVFIGTRAVEFTRKFAKFNVVTNPHKLSYAAFCLRQITEGIK